GMAKPPQLISSGWATTQLLSGIISVIIYLIIMLGCGIVWFYRWEGRKHYE
ncbi:MAG: lantibiotic immunity ABC transporter MutG family permease subunit, partial [Lachnospiraceae bacterium]